MAQQRIAVTPTLQETTFNQEMQARQQQIQSKMSQLRDQREQEAQSTSIVEAEDQNLVQRPQPKEFQTRSIKTYKEMKQRIQSLQL